MGKFDLRVRAGELRNNVTFMRRVPGQDELGQPNVAFEPLFVAKASVGPIDGREYFGAQHFVAEINAEIKLRYEPHSQLQATDRAVVDGDQGGTFEITAVLNPEQYGRLLRVLAKRIT